MNERPLMTEAMRIAEMEERYKHYEYVVLRVQFPDGLVLQGCFRVRETGWHIYHCKLTITQVIIIFA